MRFIHKTERQNLKRAMSDVFLWYGEYDSNGFGQLYIDIGLRMCGYFLERGEYQEAIIALISNCLNNVKDYPRAYRAIYDTLHDHYMPEVFKAVLALTQNDGELFPKYIEKCKDNTLARKVKYQEIKITLEALTEDRSYFIDYMKALNYLYSND